MAFIRKKSKLLLFLCFVIWVICVAFAERRIPFEEDENPREFDPYFAEIRDAFVAEMEQEHRITCSQMSFSPREKIDEFNFSFQVWQRATVEEARVWMVFATEKLLQKINAHEKIRPYLREYPFPPGRALIDMRFYNSFNQRPADGSVSMAFHVGSKATTEWGNYLFYTFDEAFFGLSKKEVGEPYEEALKIVQASGITKPIPHQMTDLEAGSDELFITFVKKMTKDRDFQFEAIGGKLEDGFEEVAATFIYFHPTTQEGARQVIVHATESLRTLVNENEKLRPYLKESSFPSSRIKMRLKFQNRRYIPYYEESIIRSVVIENDELTYITLDSDDKEMTLVIQEPYDKALRIVKNQKSTHD
jgi:hypothetical protein